MIAINLTSKYMSINIEYQIFRVLPNGLLIKIELRVYKRRKRKQFSFIEQIRIKLLEAFNEFEEY